MRYLLLPFLIICSLPVFAQSTDYCKELRKSTAYAMTATGNQLINDYQRGSAPASISVEVHQINIQDMEAAYFVADTSASEGVLIIKFSNRNELYGAGAEASGIQPVSREIWENFKQEEYTLDIYNNVLYGSPIYSYMRYVLKQQYCSL